MRISKWVFLSMILLSSCSTTKGREFIADSNIVKIPVIENHESMVDLKQVGGIQYGPSPEIANNTNYTKMRHGVYLRLKQAEASLPEGLHFCLYEGYRSLELQKMIFNNRFVQLQKFHPDWSKDEVFVEATRLVSPVINLDGSKNIPPHSTGGALDVYLVNDAGEFVPMGIHPKDWMLDLDGKISETASTTIPPEAQRNRKIMSRALSAAGFTNYTKEYWHWSYGDRYWAFMTGHDHAIYDTWK